MYFNTERPKPNDFSDCNLDHAPKDPEQRKKYIDVVRRIKRRNSEKAWLIQDFRTPLNLIDYDLTPTEIEGILKELVQIRIDDRGNING